MWPDLFHAVHADDDEEIMKLEAVEEGMRRLSDADTTPAPAPAPAPRPTKKETIFW